MPVSALFENLEDGALVSEFVDWFLASVLNRFVRCWITPPAARSPRPKCAYCSTEARPNRCVAP